MLGPIPCRSTYKLINNTIFYPGMNTAFWYNAVFVPGCFSFFHCIQTAEFPGVRLYHSSSRDTLSVTQIFFQVPFPSHEINRINVIISFNSFSDFLSNPYHFPSFIPNPSPIHFPLILIFPHFYFK